VLIDLVTHLRLTGALDHLLRWTRDPDPDVRAASLRALGILGPDDRTFYHALKALTDPVLQVRAMAARTLGMTGRSDAVDYLIPRLLEDWLVAVEAALSLRKLGPDGLAALTASAAGDDDVAALVQHVLWNSRKDTGAIGA
jgi:HEAT repeat protein